jgi:hypothetical protein
MPSADTDAPPGKGPQVTRQYWLEGNIRRIYVIISARAWRLPVRGRGCTSSSTDAEDPAALRPAPAAISSEARASPWCSRPALSITTGTFATICTVSGQKTLGEKAETGGFD